MCKVYIQLLNTNKLKHGKGNYKKEGSFEIT